MILTPIIIDALLTKAELSYTIPLFKGESRESLTVSLLSIMVGGTVQYAEPST